MRTPKERQLELLPFEAPANDSQEEKDGGGGASVSL